MISSRTSSEEALSETARFTCSGSRASFSIAGTSPAVETVIRRLEKPGPRPWNKFAQVGREAKLSARAELREPALADLARLGDAAFRALFAKSPVKRIGRDRFVRNVLIAIGNSGDAALAAEAERLLDDASPLVRGAAVWALSRLLPPDAFSARSRRADAEIDEVVRREWRECATRP